LKGQSVLFVEQPRHPRQWHCFREQLASRVLGASAIVGVETIVVDLFG
jgi:hypothetical protein